MVRGLQMMFAEEDGEAAERPAGTVCEQFDLVCVAMAWLVDGDDVDLSSWQCPPAADGTVPSSCSRRTRRRAQVLPNTMTGAGDGKGVPPAPNATSAFRWSQRRRRRLQFWHRPRRSRPVTAFQPPASYCKCRYKPSFRGKNLRNAINDTEYGCGILRRSVKAGWETFFQQSNQPAVTRHRTSRGGGGGEKKTKNAVDPPTLINP